MKRYLTGNALLGAAAIVLTVLMALSGVILRQFDTRLANIERRVRLLDQKLDWIILNGEYTEGGKTNTRSNRAF